MGLGGNDLRRLYFKDVRVPAENVLGEPGEGFRIAMQILNNGRIGLGTGSVGATKKLLDMSIEHVKERRQFGQPLADFELVQDKIGWMVSYLFGIESMCYLTCGLVDAGARMQQGAALTWVVDPELLARAQRDCFVGASLTARPRYEWRVNGELVR